MRGAFDANHNVVVEHIGIPLAVRRSLHAGVAIDRLGSVVIIVIGIVVVVARMQRTGLGAYIAGQVAMPPDVGEQKLNGCALLDKSKA